MYTGNLTAKIRWEFCPVFLRQKATWWTEIEILVHADSWRFHKKELLGSLFPVSCQKEKNVCLSSFQLTVFLYLFSAIFESAAYFGACFSWAQNSILLLCQMYLPLFFFIISTAANLRVQLQSCVNLKTTLSRKAKEHFTKDKT